MSERELEGAAPPSFEEAFAVVDSVVERLESGDLSLEESLREYERGLGALRQCRAILEGARRRIEILAAAEGAAAPRWEPAQGHPGLGEALQSLDRELGESSG